MTTPEEHRRRDTVGAINLDHAIADLCTDPDCEIHNPDVAMQEEVIGLTDLAFYIAGYFAGAAAAGDKALDVKQDLLDELMNEGVLPRPQEGE
jgi:hypothetical protein